MEDVFSDRCRWTSGCVSAIWAQKEDRNRLNILLTEIDWEASSDRWRWRSFSGIWCSRSSSDQWRWFQWEMLDLMLGNLNAGSDAGKRLRSSVGLSDCGKPRAVSVLHSESVTSCETLFFVQLLFTWSREVFLCCFLLGLKSVDAVCSDIFSFFREVLFSRRGWGVKKRAGARSYSINTLCSLGRLCCLCFCCLCLCCLCLCCLCLCCQLSKRKLTLLHPKVRELKQKSTKYKTIHFVPARSSWE